ncbi:hypothetical protein [Halocatena pleomorpha]|uniref:PH domain-containing protein n=1 Tax=Halocatena pleomorpha TaxID=1785090 RepID=A0A3P3R2V8_9EURY|nr:hypothetical protein [Halocatena pleomorpha]RRJ27811.1 hypothetical protein EIK79_17160 [Halocatena pleomorpha]
MAVPEVPVFSEEQRFESWIPALIVATGVPVPVVLGVEMGVRGGVLLGTGVALAPLALFVPARLTTEVTESGLSVQLFPLHLRARRVPFSEIESVERVQLSAGRSRRVRRNTTPRGVDDGATAIRQRME